MGKKKNSKPNPSILPNSTTEQADQESISTCDSSITRATTPPPDGSLSAAVESLRQQFKKMAKTMQYLTDKVTELEQLKSSTVTPNSIITDTIPGIFEKLNYNTTATKPTRELFYNFKRDVKDYLGL